MNDIAIQRSEIERHDWAYLSHLMQNIENRVVLADGSDHIIGRTLQHHTTDKRRKVRQCFTVSLIESALDGAEGLGEI